MIIRKKVINDHTNIISKKFFNMKKVEKFWRLVAQINKHRISSQELKHEPTEDDIQNFAEEIDSDFCEIKVEIFWKQKLNENLI